MSAEGGEDCFPDGARVLLIGAAGMGMVPLGLILAAKGCRVIAYDDAMPRPIREQYRTAGVVVWDGFGTFPSVDRVVCSSAVREDHRLRAEAVNRGCPVSLRGQALAEVVNRRRLLAVVGSHGKTTTTAMLVDLLSAAGLEPGFLIGGLPADGSPPGAWGQDPIFVAEVDESDGTIECFRPEWTLWLNFDPDHVVRYAREEDLRAAFSGLIRRTREIAWVPRGEFTEEDGAGPTVRFWDQGVEPDRDRRSRIPDYNRRNLAAARAAVGGILGKEIRADVADDLRGVCRRQTTLFDDGETVVREDYAHHPTEVAAFLQSEQTLYPNFGYVCVFQPHRYSRTRQHAKGFARNLETADRSLLLPVYGAGEGIEMGDGAAAILGYLKKATGAVSVAPDLAGGLEWLIEDRRTHAGCRHYAIVGAGSVERLGRAWAAWLRSGGDEERAWRHYLEGRLDPETRVSFGVSLAAKTTVRVGGGARIYAEPAGIDDLRVLVEAAAVWGLDWFVIGRGSNLLFPDDGFGGLILSLRHGYWRGWEVSPDGTVEVGPGLRMQELAQRAADLGWSGFEFAEGIPGSVGGSLRMNAGAMGSWILDRLVWVETLDPGGVRRRWCREELTVQYRSCPELERRIVLRARLRREGVETPDAIRGRMAALAARRRATQPTGRSAGCAFKNPPGDSAGRLIDAAGLKGYTVGGASVSDVHANFIVNDGTATAGDVGAVMAHVAAVVERVHGVRLEPEIVTPKPFSIDTLSGPR